MFDSWHQSSLSCWKRWSHSSINAFLAAWVVIKFIYINTSWRHAERIKKNFFRKINILQLLLFLQRLEQAAWISSKSVFKKRGVTQSAYGKMRTAALEREEEDDANRVFAIFLSPSLQKKLLQWELLLLLLLLPPDGCVDLSDDRARPFDAFSYVTH